MYNRLFLSFWFLKERKKRIYLNKIIMNIYKYMFCFQMAAFTQEKVNKAKMSIENFYANLINQHEEREER